MKTKKSMLESAYAKLKEYVDIHGKIQDEIKYWDTHPVVFRDKCVDAVILINGEIELCEEYKDGKKLKFENPFREDRKVGKYNIIEMKDKRTIEHGHIETLIKDMEKYDNKGK